MAPPWMVAEFKRTLDEVHERLVRSGPSDPLVSLRRMLSSLDHPSRGADSHQLRQAAVFLGTELERRSRHSANDDAWGLRPARDDRPPLAALDALFEYACREQPLREHEVGGRSL